MPYNKFITNIWSEHMNYTITYLKCQSCTAKIHCDACADEIRERLLGEGVKAVIDIPNRSAAIETAMDEDDLLDLLEEIGVFAD
jgi:hypothetical protein